MQKNIRNVSETEQEIEIILTADEFKPEIDKELEEARRTVKIKGFRQGHVPMGMIKRFVGPSVEASVAEKMASTHFGTIADAEGIKPASRAQIESYTYNDDTLTILLSYEIHPAFELKDLSAYSFTKADYTVTDEDVEREIRMILKGHGTLVVSENPAGTNDTVIADVTKLDAEGQPVEDVKNENHHFNLEYLPADNPFRTSLEGKKAGDTVEVTVEPKEEDGKQGRYLLEVKEIKYLELPEMTDELVNEITSKRFETVSDFRTDVRKQLEEYFSNKSEEELLEAISAKLIEEHEIPVPKAMTASFQQMLFEKAKRQIGGRLPKGFDESEFVASMRPNAEKHARWLLIGQKIAELNGLNIGNDDIRAYAEKEAEKSAELNVEDLYNTYMSTEFRDYIVDTILKEKIYDIIKSKITVTLEPTPIPANAE